MNDETVADINALLDRDKRRRSLATSWNQLNQTAKMNKLREFAYQVYQPTDLTDSPDLRDKLFAFLEQCLRQNKLSRVKDVVMDKATGIIQDIPMLAYNSTKNNYTLRSI